MITSQALVYYNDLDGLTAHVQTEKGSVAVHSSMEQIANLLIMLSVDTVYVQYNDFTTYTHAAAAYGVSIIRDTLQSQKRRGRKLNMVVHLQAHNGTNTWSGEFTY